MMDSVATAAKVFSTVERSAFVGRTAEGQRLFAHAYGKSPSMGLALLAPPAAGGSELLAQVYDQLFFEQPNVVPFYFQLKREDRTAHSAASRFLNEFIAQTVAFRSKEPGIIDAAPDIREISRFASELDAAWIVPLLEGYTNGNQIDERVFIRQCISAPLRICDTQGHVFVMIDDVQNSLYLENGDAFLADLTATFERSPIPVVFCGLRRFLYDLTGFPQMTIGQLSFAEASQVVSERASSLGVSINEQTRDLIAVQLGCRPAHIATFITSAYEAGAELSSFARTEQFYTDQIFGGRLSRRYDSVLDQITSEASVKAQIVGQLRQVVEAERHRISIEDWEGSLEPGDVNKSSTLKLLHYNEIANFDGSNVTVDPNDLLLMDSIESRSRLASDERPRALIVGETMARNLRRAPQLMARFYRKQSSVGLLELLRTFDGRQISPTVLDYERYRNELKGAARERALKAIQEDNTRIRLPKCLFSAQTSAYYPSLDEICEPERSATAICEGDGTDSTDIVWIAAEIDSKLEATEDVAEFWCDRLEMVAVSCNFENYRIWLVATEGFDSNAMAALSSRGAIGSSREQAEILREILSDTVSTGREAASDVYEFVVPMGSDTEMIAAHTVEEIARRHNYPPKVINQIKTALVEACINASEHSLSPDKRIYQTFKVDNEKITITVGNRGIRMEREPEITGTADARRGWGLRLIRSLMDEVHFDATDDGTIITMVKYAGRTDDPTADPRAAD